MSNKRPLVSDLVRDSKINTEFLESCIQHVFLEAGQSLKQRLVRREERWVRQRYLGRGSYGTVYLERREDGDTKELRAVKELKKSVVAGRELDYARELEAIMKFSHPRYRHCFVSSRGWYEHEDSVFITMEFLELGDLQRHLTRPLPESQGQEITKQTLEGLSFMHDNGFIHRDLKPANIMVVTKGPNWFVKIADFGISRRRHHDVTTFLTLQRGTLGFAAPEALGVDSDTTYSYWVDMWSLGAVAYRILTNTSAFLSLSELFRYTSGILQFPEEKLKSRGVSELGRDFIFKLMQPVPEERLSAAQAMLHPWFTSPLLPTVEDTSNMSHLATVEEEYDVTDVSMPSKAWSTDDQTTIRTPVSITTEQEQQVKDPTVTSKAPTPEDSTTIRAHRTVRPVSESNYKPPSVEDCSDDNYDSGQLPKLPSDSRWVLDLEDDLDDDDDDTSEGSTAESEQDSADLFDEPVTRQDSIRQNRKDTVPLDPTQPVDTEESAETDCTDEESEYESDTDVDDQEEAATTPRHSTENTEKESDNTAPGVECKGCGIFYELKSGQIQHLPCQHNMCHFCLSQCIALSLISPKYLPARCCDRPEGEIPKKPFGDEPINPRIHAILNKYRQLKDHDNWRCPRGHPPKGGSLLVTVGSRNSPPIWKELVSCTGCLTETQPLSGPKSSRPTSFCILCSREVAMDACKQCEQSSVVRPFIKRMQERTDAPVSWLTSVLKFAHRDTLDIKNGASQVQFQTLAELKGLPPPDEGQSESEAEDTKTGVEPDCDDTEKPASPDPSTASTSHLNVGSETGSRRSRSKRKKSSHNRRQSPKPTRARILWEKITPQMFHSQPKKKKKK